MKSVLLTRSKLANLDIKDRLKAKSFEFLDCSLIEYEAVPFDFDKLKHYSDLIITSFHAANQLPTSPVPSMPVWTVGENSAKHLEKKGYHVKFFAQNAESLRVQIPEEIYDSTLYLSGNNISINMPVLVSREVFYHVSYRESLSKEQILRYKQGIDYILLYSENCAKTLLKLLQEKDLVNYLDTATVLAISPKVGRVVKYHFRDIQICSSADSIIEFLEQK